MPRSVFFETCPGCGTRNRKWSSGHARPRIGKGRGRFIVACATTVKNLCVRVCVCVRARALADTYISFIKHRYKFTPTFPERPQHAFSFFEIIIARETASIAHDCVSFERELECNRIVIALETKMSSRMNSNGRTYVVRNGEAFVATDRVLITLYCRCNDEL